MEINRRNFFKALGVTGVTLAVGSKLLASEAKESAPAEFSGILFDATRCQGCHSCEMACAEANGLPDPTPAIEAAEAEGLKRETSDTCRTVVNLFKTTKGEVNLKTQCMHCNEPACAAACLTGAMLKTKEGPVVWRSNKCMGCRYCMVSCPFDAPKFEYHSPNPHILKCTMCAEKIAVGQLPACVENCPNEALMFGKRRDLIQESRKRILENPGSYLNEVYGEHEAGGTGWLYLSPVPFGELALKTNLQHSSYPELTKGFLYSVPSVFVLVPALLLGIRQATQNNSTNSTNDHE